MGTKAKKTRQQAEAPAELAEADPALQLFDPREQAVQKLPVARTQEDKAVVGRLLRLEEVRAEAAQARKNLSTLPGDALPPVWAKVRGLGPDAIDALVLVAIIFSDGMWGLSAARTSNTRSGSPR